MYLQKLRHMLLIVNVAKVETYCVTRLVDKVRLTDQL